VASNCNGHWAKQEVSGGLFEQFKGVEPSGVQV